MTAELELKLRSLPDSPGCYLMKSQGKIIYVGKAKNLKNRVSQYFHASRDHTVKVRAMVEKVDDFDIVLVDSELEALILECNLIKRHKPWYNILLKDDKHYPYIRIDLRVDYPTAWSWCAALKRMAQNTSAPFSAPPWCAKCWTWCAPCSRYAPAAAPFSRISPPDPVCSMKSASASAPAPAR